MITSDPVSNQNGLHISDAVHPLRRVWRGPLESVAFDAAAMRDVLLTLDRPCYVVNHGGRIGLTHAGALHRPGQDNGQDPAPGLETLLVAPPLRVKQLGDPAFCAAHGVRYAYASGAMANGIASADLVIAMGRAGLLSSFGAAGLPPQRVEEAIRRIQAALPQGSYAFNLIHSPHEDALERHAVDLYLQHGVTTVEASAFLDLTPHVVRYRAAGLSRDERGEIAIKNRIIAKLSRREVATKFMEPAPERLLRDLVAQNLITPEQAELAAQVPVADDITVEADSGGHTDNRPLVSLLPAILALRDEIQEQYAYATPIRVGAAGGISTPHAALAAFMMGAAYVVSGSINQSCVEAAASAHTKTLLAEADMADVIMAPAADMFEMGVQVQVLKRGTLFAMRAQKLYDLYQTYAAIEEIPASQRERLEKQIFHKSLDAVWDDTVAFFNERDPEQIARAEQNPKRKMALIFRWYLGLSSRWSNVGEAGREIDYQIWCGPAMGAFNEWVRGSYLEKPENRHVADVAHHIMTGAAYLYRLHSLTLQGVTLPAACRRYQPQSRTENAIAAEPSTASVPAAQPPATAQPAAPATPSFAATPVAESVTAEEPPTALDPDIDADAIQEWLVLHLAARLGAEPDDIDVREPFDSYNLDSAHVLILANELEEWLGCELSPTLLWNYPTIEQLAQRLATMQTEPMQ